MNADAPEAKDTKQVSNVFRRLPTSLRGHVVAVLGELIGTFSFIFFAFGGTQVCDSVHCKIAIMRVTTLTYCQVAAITANGGGSTSTAVNTTVASKSPEQLLYISLSFGFSLAVNAWVFFRISGGLFNPAVGAYLPPSQPCTTYILIMQVTLGMLLIGKITIVRAILLGMTQCVGAIAAAFVVQALFSGGLNVDTTPSATTSNAQAVIVEMLLTAQLVFTIFMLAAEKHTGNYIAPVGIGLSLFIAELVGVFWTGGSLNPARSLAPPVATRSFHNTQWIYWVGPFVGAILAVIIYKIVTVLEYTTAGSLPGDEVLPTAEPERTDSEPRKDSDEDVAATKDIISPTGYATSYQPPVEPRQVVVPRQSAAVARSIPEHGQDSELLGSSFEMAPVSRGRYEPQMYAAEHTGAMHDGTMHHAGLPIEIVSPMKVL